MEAPHTPRRARDVRRRAVGRALHFSKPIPWRSIDGAMRAHGIVVRDVSQAEWLRLVLASTDHGLSSLRPLFTDRLATSRTIYETSFGVAWPIVDTQVADAVLPGWATMRACSARDGRAAATMARTAR